MTFLRGDWNNYVYKIYQYHLKSKYKISSCRLGIFAGRPIVSKYLRSDTPTVQEFIDGFRLK